MKNFDDIAPFAFFQRPAVKLSLPDDCPGVIKKRRSDHDPESCCRRRSMLPSRLAAKLAIGMIGLLALIGSAAAQSIERNLPQAPQAVAPTIAQLKATPFDQDATLVGPNLRAIILLGPTDKVVSNPVSEIDLKRIPRLEGKSGALAPFLGRPLSMKLIAEMEADIVRQYRAMGFPFVSVSAPEQEITAGILNIRVVELRLGAKTAPGASSKDAPYIESRVRLTANTPIGASELSQDIDWLNRFPFRHTEAAFTPGTGVGLTDLHLRTTSSKPWSVYVGYADSGSPLTGVDRYFAGAQTILPGLHDALISYQFTSSNDAVLDHQQLFNVPPDPRYISQAGRLTIPTFPRQDVEASVSYVQSNETNQDFLVRATTYEATLAYRSALSNLWAALPGELAVGVEAKRQTTRTLFGGTDIIGASFDVFQFTASYAQQESDAWGKTSGDLTLHLSPGSADHRNTAVAFATYSKGRFDIADYGYMSGDLTRYTHLPPLIGISGFAFANSLIAQYSAAPLPLTEQIGLGNSSLVRGYTLDDGAFDIGVVSRNELRTPSFTVLGRSGKVTDQLSPFVFVDAGYGRDQRTEAEANPVSTGLGADYQVGSHLTATIDGAWALNSVGLTKSGNTRVESRMTLTF